MIVKTVKLVDLTGMHKTGCSGEMCCVYLAHHELESVVIIGITIMPSAGQVWIL